MVKLFENLREKLGMTTTDEPIPEAKEEKRVFGKIIKVSATGYGFISSKDIPFTRIFFHWTSLKSDTINFKDLRSGMRVSFICFEVEDRGWRAIKIKVEPDE
jgi:cold shock CspA family protein